MNGGQAVDPKEVLRIITQEARDPRMHLAGCLHYNSLSTMESRMDTSLIQLQKLKRLKVNRVALVQTIRVEHVLPCLIDYNVLDQHDCDVINSAQDPQTKVKLLLNILPSKGKNVDWYGHFRNALKHPHVRNDDAKKQYQILVEFLDNTIIPVPKKLSYLSLDRDSEKVHNGDALPGPQTNADKCELSTMPPKSRVKFVLVDTNDEQSKVTQDGTNNENKKYKFSGGSVDDKNELIDDESFSTEEMKILDEHESVLQKPHDLFYLLESSDADDDKQQLEQEILVYEKMQFIESLLYLNKEGVVSVVSKVIMSSSVYEFLTNRQNHHLYFKYIEQLQSNTGFNILKAFGGIYCAHIESLEEDETPEHMTKRYVELGFGLVDFMYEYGIPESADGVLQALLQYLSINLCLSNWMATWHGTIRLMQINNFNTDFDGTDLAHKAAQNVAYHINMMSFAKSLVNKAAMFSHLSAMHMEKGNIPEAFTMALSSLKESPDTDEETVIKVMCAAADAYAAKGFIKKAGLLSIQAVKHARSLHGTNNPLYIKALLALCHHLSDFWKSAAAIQLAQKAIELCSKVYRSNHIQTAEAHRTLARVLIKNDITENGEYMTMARKSYEMAQAKLPFNHPRLATFAITSAECLVIYAESLGNNEERMKQLLKAKSEAELGLHLAQKHWGATSLLAAKAHLTLANICLHFKRVEEAETFLLKGYNALVSSTEGASCHLQMYQIHLADFYCKLDRLEQAKALYIQILQNIEVEVYQPWVDAAYRKLLTVLEDDDLRRGQVQMLYEQWLQDHPEPNHLPTDLQALEGPPDPIQQFLHSFDHWSEGLKTLRQGLKQMKKLSLTQQKT